ILTLDLNQKAEKQFINLMRRGDNAKKLVKLQNQHGGRIFLQDIKKPNCDDWESGLGLSVMECALHLEKSVVQSLLELHKLATDKNDPHVCDFIETYYLDEQMKSIKQLNDHVTNLARLMLPGQCMHVRVTFTFSINCTRTST
ncbi:Ferritin heavy chain, partial [Fukomys damarensis]